MSQYPTANIPNGWQIAGGALTDLSKVLTEDQDRQQKLRMAMAEMAQKRAAAILAQKAAEDKARADEFEYTQKKDQADRDAKYREWLKGEDVSPSASKSVAPQAQAGRDPALSAAVDRSVDGINMPNQDVGGDSSWDLLNRATDASIAAAPPVRKGRTPEEIIDYGNQYGTQDEAKKYVDNLKALREKPVDFFNNPALLADFHTKAQDPAFQQIAQGYATNPAKFGPLLNEWALHNGYTGQRWWAAELGKMYHAAPPQPGATPTLNPQVAMAQKFSQENTLRDEYAKGTAKFEIALPAFAKAQQALERNNPADAYSAIINFVRTLDPASTVREAEEKLARMSAAGGMLNQFFQAVRTKTVGGLNEDVRRNLYDAGRGLLSAEFDQSYKPTRDKVRDQTLNYPDPRGKEASLDTSNTIGRGLDKNYNTLMSRDIFAKPEPAEPRPKPSPRPPPSTHPKATAVRRLAEKILNNPKSSPEDKAKATEALRRLEAP